MYSFLTKITCSANQLAGYHLHYMLYHLPIYLAFETSGMVAGTNEGLVQWPNAEITRPNTGF